MHTCAAPIHWQPAVLTHPDLTPAEKLVFHLLMQAGGDTAQAGQQMAQMLGLTERHVRRIRHRLRTLNLSPVAAEETPVVPDLQVHSSKPAVPSGPSGPDLHAHSSGSTVPNGPTHPDLPVQTDPPVRSLNARYSTAFEEHSTTTVLVPPYPPPGVGEIPTKPVLGQQTPSTDPANVPAQVAELVQEWDQTFPTTAQGPPSDRDREAIEVLLTQHGKSAADIRTYIAHIRDQHKLTYWPRPARLIQHTQRGQGPLVFALIETQIAALKEQPYGTHRPTRRERTVQRNAHNRSILAYLQAAGQTPSDAFGFDERLAVAGRA